MLFRSVKRFRVRRREVRAGDDEEVEDASLGVRDVLRFVGVAGVTGTGTVVVEPPISTMRGSSVRVREWDNIDEGWELEGTPVMAARERGDGREERLRSIESRRMARLLRGEVREMSSGGPGEGVVSD